MTFDINDVLNELNINEDTPPAAMVSTEESQILIKGIATKLKCSENIAYGLLCIICQKGGTSKRAQGSVYAISDSYKLDLTQIRTIMKETGLKFTLRQWARTNASNIFKISAKYSIEGDLAKKLSREDESISTEEKYWMSNFQMDNPDCPSQVRKKLMEHYKKLFPEKE